jgi:hypothetical protein
LATTWNVRFVTQLSFEDKLGLMIRKTEAA